MIVSQCRQLSISVPRLITKTFTYALHVTPSATLIHRVKLKRPCLGVIGTSNEITGIAVLLREHAPTECQQFAKGNVNTEASENASISGTISHRYDNQLRTHVLCVELW